MNRTVCTLATALLLTQLGPSAQADAALEQLLALSPDQAARQVLTPQERAVLKALEQSNQRGAKGASTKPVVTGPNEVRFIYGASRPMVVCSLLHVCDIALEPGENVLDLKIGDGARWLIERSVSGHEGAIVEHIALKPTDIGLNTNLRIYTDKRTYYLDLKSTAAEFMPQVSFIYPEATLERYHSLKAELSRAQQARAFSGAPQTGQAGGARSRATRRSIHCASSMTGARPSFRCRPSSWPPARASRPSSWSTKAAMPWAREPIAAWALSTTAWSAPALSSTAYLRTCACS